MGSSVLLLPEASHKDKDAGWLALVQMHLDTDLNGPAGTRNHQTGTTHHEQAAGHTRLTPLYIKDLPRRCQHLLPGWDMSLPTEVSPELLCAHGKQEWPPVCAFLTSLKSGAWVPFCNRQFCCPRTGNCDKMSEGQLRMSGPSLSNLRSVLCHRFLHSTEVCCFC